MRTVNNQKTVITVLCWEKFKATMKPTDDGDYKRRITRGFVCLPDFDLDSSGLAYVLDLYSVVLIQSGL